MWDNELPTSSFWTRDQPYRWSTQNNDEKLWIGAEDQNRYSQGSIELKFLRNLELNRARRPKWKQDRLESD